MRLTRWWWVPDSRVPVTTDGRPFLRVLPAWRICLKFCFFVVFFQHQINKAITFNQSLISLPRTYIRTLHQSSDSSPHFSNLSPHQSSHTTLTDILTYRRSTLRYLPRYTLSIQTRRAYGYLPGSKVPRYLRSCSGVKAEISYGVHSPARSFKLRYGKGSVQILPATPRHALTCQDLRFPSRKDASPINERHYLSILTFMIRLP